jgi:uncharacterized membrane protein
MIIDIPEQEILERVLELQAQGKLALKKPQVLAKTRGHIFSQEAIWYWLTVALAFSCALSIFMVPESAYPAIYVRYVLGGIFIWFLPGYSFVKLLFPTRVPIPTSSTELDSVERAVLSIGMSVVLVIINGFLLNFTSWGIVTNAATISLLVVIIVFATAAIIRERKAEQASAGRN